MVRADSGERRAGFTLVEMTMVLAIIGVIVAMAAPRWGRAVAHYQTDAAARRVCADLAWAQARARVTSSSLTVHFDLTGDQYQFVGMPDPDHPASVYTVNLSGFPYRATIASASTLDASGNITFDGYGNPATSGTIVLQSGDFQRTVSVSASSGAISLR